MSIVHRQIYLKVKISVFNSFCILVLSKLAPNYLKNQMIHQLLISIYSSLPQNFKKDCFYHQFLFVFADISNSYIFSNHHPLLSSLSQIAHYCSKQALKQNGQYGVQTFFQTFSIQLYQLFLHNITLTLRHFFDNFFEVSYFGFTLF